MASRSGSVHVAVTRREYKGKVYETTLLRRSYREGRKVKSETVGNLSHLPAGVIDLIRRSLNGEEFMPVGDIEVARSRAHGHVRLVLELVRDLGFDRMLGARPSPERQLALALIIGRLLFPSSKLASVRTWTDTTLLEELGVEGPVGVQDVYSALDWLLGRQTAVQAALVSRHLKAGALVLYDVSSSYMTGTHCPIAKRGYSRDHRHDLPQVVYGVVTDVEGRPVAVEVFDGNTRDCTTVMGQVEALRKRYKLRRMVVVGDRGMITDVQVDLLERYPNIDWITALTNPQVAGLLESGALQLGLFDDQNLLATTSPDFPGQRLVACRNTALARSRAAAREALLVRTEARLERIAQSVARGRCRGADAIGERVGRAWKTDRMRKHFAVEITNTTFTFRRDAENIAREAALDGIYVVRTSIDESPDWSAEHVVRAYKRLAEVERVFRAMKTTQLLVRPIFHRQPDRVRGHIFLCMLAAHLAWELERRLAAFLYVDPGLDTARPTRDPVAPPSPSAEGRRKKREHVTNDGESPLHGVRTLLASMGSLSRVTLRVGPGATFDKDATATPWQARVLEAVAQRASA